VYGFLQATSAMCFSAEAAAAAAAVTDWGVVAADVDAAEAWVLRLHADGVDALLHCLTGHDQRIYYHKVHSHSIGEACVKQDASTEGRGRWKRVG
jgi:hypothetical protein